MKMKKYKKSSWVTIALLVYITLTAIILLPRNTELGGIERWVTLGGAYLIVLVLWWVLRKKEELQQKRKEELNKTKQHNKTNV